MNKENKVTQANALVTAYYNTTVEEFRIARTLVSFVQPDDIDFKPYTIRIADFMKLIGVNDQSKYSKMERITANLTTRLIKIRQGKRLLQVCWLSSADYKYGEGVVELQFDPKLKPFLLELKNSFVTYHLESAIRLNGSRYSGRFYEILKANEYKATYEVKVSALIEIFQLGKSYSNFFEIRRRILEPVKNELAEKTDICFTYEEIKERKKIIALKFHIRANPKNKPNKALPEPPKQSNTTTTNRTDVEAIKAEFKRLYGSELVDKFVAQMLTEKGLEHVQECLRTYKDYIQGQEIRNLGGHFREFVMSGYQKPTPHNGKDTITAPKYEAFRATDEERREVEESYTTAGRRSYEKVGKVELKSINEILAGRIKIPET